MKEQQYQQRRKRGSTDLTTNYTAQDTQLWTSQPWLAMLLRLKSLYCTIYCTIQAQTKKEFVP